MTAQPDRRPIPALITLALDAIGADGAWVDEACGAQEPAVDRWETGELAPTDEQLALLAKLTGNTVEFFFRGDLAPPALMFVCDRTRRKNGCTVVMSSIDAAGRLQSTVNGKDIRRHPHLPTWTQDTLI